jgi:hypothetical protein
MEVKNPTSFAEVGFHFITKRHSNLASKFTA